MGKIPRKCPKCGGKWKVAATRTESINPAGAVYGAYLFGLPGLIAGSMGKQRRTYRCDKCGFKKDYIC